MAPPVSKKARTNEDPPAVSLGKPSLKVRLEAYYALVSKDQISDPTEWRSKFDKIWDKYGGTHAGEQKLATKLAKKYGTAVRLLTVATVTSQQQDEQKAQQSAAALQNVAQHAEEWYELNQKEKGSGCIDFLSDRFDPVAALQTSNINSVLEAHPHIQNARILDRVDQFRPFLPPTDPLFRQPTKPKVIRSKPVSEKDTTKTKALSCFAATAALHETGPLSVLFKALSKRQRVRVVTRYVDGIRGTLTGYLIAFDKHTNLILQDVDEHYTPRRRNDNPNDNGDDSAAAGPANTFTTTNNLEAELHRRLRGMKAQSAGGDWTNRQRHMRQIMVRGDSVVAVYKASEERSAWPVTSKSPTVSEYRCNSMKRGLPADQRVGTPGSLIYAAQRRQAKQQQLPAISSGKRDYRS